MSGPPRIVFAGGGTGGHLCPAVAVAEALLVERPDAEVLFLGSGKPLERRILAPTGFRYEAVPAAPLEGGAGRVRFAWSQTRGVVRAWSLLRTFAPTAVLGLGGFPSAPGVVAGRLLGAPVALFEPNATPGRANLALARFAREAYVAWPETSLPGLELQRTGTPPGANAARGADASPAVARRLLGLPADRPALLVMGGSQGARALNAWVVESLPRLVRSARASFIHLAGTPEAAAEVGAAYAASGAAHCVLPFLDRMGLAYRAASLAVVRGGGATLAELLAAGLPGVVVPLPRSAGGHQAANAAAFAATGAGWAVEEAALDPGTLGWALDLLEDATELTARAERARAAGRPAAARDVARRLVALGSPAADDERDRRAA